MHLPVLDWLADGCAVAAVSGAIYEVVAVVTRWFPPLTDLVWGWRLYGQHWLLWLVVLVWIGLGWHLFVEMRGAP